MFAGSAELDVPGSADRASAVEFLPMRSHLVSIAAVASVGLVAPVALADINGFGDFAGFTLNQGDTGSAPSVSPNSIQITSGIGQYRSIFYNTPQSIGSFSASYDYRVPTGVRYLGVTFVIQNSPSGVNALGAHGNGLRSFGYGGITNSVGVTLEGEFGDNTTRTGMFTNGVVGSGSIPTDPILLTSGHTIHVNLTYNGSVLTQSLLDTTTGQSNFVLLRRRLPAR
jgi:hypothetical protein